MKPVLLLAAITALLALRYIIKEPSTPERLPDFPEDYGDCFG